MQQLVHKDKEPITPFIDKVRPLYDEHGISTVLVVGGAGDYLAVADQVIMMDEYEPVDATERARQIAMQYTDERQVEGREPFAPSKERTVGSASFAPDARKKPTAKGLHTILLNRREIQLSSVEQLIDPSQTRAIAEILRLLPVQFLQKNKTMAKVVDEVYEQLEQDGLDSLSPFRGRHPGYLALPRKQEVFAAINRIRGLKVK